MPSTAQLLLRSKTSGGMNGCRTSSATPAVAGQLVHLTSSASQHPAMWKLLAHESNSEAGQLAQRAANITVPTSAQLLLCSQTSGGVNDSVARERYTCGSWSTCAPHWLCVAALAMWKLRHTSGNSEAEQLVRRTATLTMPSSA